MREEGLDQKYKLPKVGLDNPIGSVIVRGLMAFQPKGCPGIRHRNLGAEFSLNTTKAETELGMVWSSTDDAIRDQARFLDAKGHLGRAPPGEAVVLAAA